MSRKAKSQGQSVILVPIHEGKKLQIILRPQGSGLFVYIVSFLQPCKGGRVMVRACYTCSR